MGACVSFARAGVRVRACVHMSAALLTLPPAATDFTEAGSIAQPVEPLLLDQLHDLGLDLLPQLP